MSRVGSAPEDAPVRTFTLASLAEAAGVTVRTARHYLTEDVVPRPKPRGRATAYGEEHLWRLRAARVMRAEGRRLPEIRARLATLTLAEVRALVEPPAAPDEARAAAPLAPGAERWERVTLLPGLELMARSDAGPLVARIAREIVESYRVAPPSGA